jgi:ABC-type uncharacterized transport system fused permease/ATPase subunit
LELGTAYLAFAGESVVASWLFLDESISALNEKLETDLDRTLAERLPNTAIVSISHRSTLGAWHSRQMEMPPSGGRLFVPRDARSEPQPQQVGAGRKA